MPESVVFQTAMALLSGQPSVFVERSAAFDIARSLTLAERGSLLPEFWSNLHAIDSRASTRNVPAQLLLLRPDAPHPQFDAAVLTAGMLALTALFVSARPQAIPDGEQHTLADLHGRIVGWLWDMHTHLTAPIRI